MFLNNLEIRGINWWSDCDDQTERGEEQLQTKGIRRRKSYQLFNRIVLFFSEYQFFHIVTYMPYIPLINISEYTESLTIPTLRSFIYFSLLI